MCLQVFLSSEEYFNESFIFKGFVRNYALNIENFVVSCLLPLPSVEKYLIC